MAPEDGRLEVQSLYTYGVNKPKMDSTFVDCTLRWGSLTKQPPLLKSVRSVLDKRGEWWGIRFNSREHRGLVNWRLSFQSTGLTPV